MNKLKATGVGVTVVLIVLAVLMAMKAVPGIAAPSDLVIPGSGKASEQTSSGPSQPVICNDCATPMENRPSAPSVSHGSANDMAASTLANVENQSDASSSGDSLAGVPTIRGAGHAGTGESNEGESVLQSGFVQAALAIGGLPGRRSVGNKDITATADVQANNSGAATSESGTSGGTTGSNDKEVLSSIAPSADDGVIAPQVRYCISPVGAYCGQEPSSSNDGPPLKLSEVKPGTDDSAPAQPESPLTQREDEAFRTTPTEIPEPATIVLIALGLAVVCVARRKAI